jgi:hypothetical protein
MKRLLQYDSMYSGVRYSMTVCTTGTTTSILVIRTRVRVLGTRTAGTRSALGFSILESRVSSPQGPVLEGPGSWNKTRIHEDC